jgi:hypothetical protein
VDCEICQIWEHNIRITATWSESCDYVAALRDFPNDGTSCWPAESRPEGVWASVACAGSSWQRFEYVSDAADGMDEGVAAGVDLLAQVGDVQLHDVSLTHEVVAPDPVEDLGLG